MKLKIKSKVWLRAAALRAVKTVAQTAIATMGTSAMICEINWKVVLSSAITAGVLSLLTSVAGLPEIKESETSE